MKALPFSSSKVKYVEVTLVNASTNYDCFNGGPVLLPGTSKNENVGARPTGRR